MTRVPTSVRTGAQRARVGIRCSWIITLLVVSGLSQLVVGSVRADEAIDEQVVLVVQEHSPAPASAPSGAQESPPAPSAEPPRTIEQIYDRFFNFPGQFWLDSPSGPKPAFGMDVVYDANGYPVPRLPDPYSYRVLQNPQDPDAMRQYLDWRRVVIRRINAAANAVPDYALTHGDVPQEALEVAHGRPYDNLAVGDYSHVNKESLGTPLMKPAQARELGMKLDEIPELPGKPAASGIEVYWFWHPRCPICLQMAREWFAFQRAVNHAGHKAVSISVSAHRTDAEIEAATDDVSSTIQIWTILWGEDVAQSRNWVDWTEATKSLGITGTPTTVFVNRKTLAIERLVGAQDAATLHATLAKVGGWDPAIWPPPEVSADGTLALPPHAAAAPANTTPIEALNK